jgi:SAM-dependent methyltransferase
MKYAEIYDLMYSDKNYPSETKYLESIVMNFKKDFTTFLDLGCGTGRHAIELAKKGFKGRGVDLSIEMVNIANKKIRTKSYSENLEFLVGDVREYINVESVDVVYALFHVASYQITDNDLKDFFKTAEQNLKSGGIFIFDYWYFPAVEKIGLSEKIKVKENNNLKITRTSYPKSITKDIFDVEFDIKIENKIDGSIENFRENHKMRALNEEILQRVKTNSLNKKGAYNWMTNSKPSTNNWNAISVYQKS